MIDNKAIIEAWEKRVSSETAHIEAKAFLSIPVLFQMFNTAFQMTELKGKRILDFGCGGGFLGEWLFQTRKGVKRYLGMDIAERSLTAARERLNKQIDKKAALIKITPWGISDLTDLNIDILASFNVIQHFPSQEYLDYFLKSVNESGASELILHYRYEKSGSRFQVEPYKTTHEINLACWTNETYIDNRLSMYKLQKSEILPGGNFQIAYFQIIEDQVENE